MEWNNLLTDLNYYLSDLYYDVNDQRRIVKKGGLPTGRIAFKDASITSWFNILSFAAATNAVVPLLEAMVTAEEGNSKDEFLLGAILNIKEDRVGSKGQEIAEKDWKVNENDTLVREKIIGEKSNILPISFLEKGMFAARSVVRVVVGKELGTGFIIKNNWLVTNNHVIPSPEHARLAQVQFNYQYQPDKNGSITLFAEKVMGLNPGTGAHDQLFFTHAKDDWTLVKMKEPVPEVYGYLTLSAEGITKDEFVNIIQHAAGGPKQIALYNNIVTFADDNIVQYLTDTLPGSSGSPVFNSNWEVVALHNSGGWVKEPGTNTKVYRNQGMNIQLLIDLMNGKNLLEN
jgi:V8-like Glu-specific endopeptidase